MLKAIIIKTDDPVIEKQLVAKYGAIVVNNSNALAYRTGKNHVASVFGASDLPNPLLNEPSLEQCGILLQSLTPSMKAVLRNLYPARKMISLKYFDRELTTRDIDLVTETFKQRALKHGFLNGNGNPVELIFSKMAKQPRSGETVKKWRLAQTARRAIELFKKPIFDWSMGVEVINILLDTSICTGMVDIVPVQIHQNDITLGDIKYENSNANHYNQAR